jgi:DNA gyrase subunit A
MIAIATTERNGKVVAATLVRADDEIMLITTGGVLIRTRVAEIRAMGRATQGVTLIALDDGTRLSGLQRIVESEAEAGNGSANGHGAQGTAESDIGDGAGAPEASPADDDGRPEGGNRGNGSGGDASGSNDVGDDGASRGPDEQA